MATKRIWVIISGGPGVYEPCDPDAHDTSWSNYVDGLLLQSRRGAMQLTKNEKILWIVYAPAYEKRWADDVKHKRPSIKGVTQQGFRNYLQLLQARAARYGYGFKAARSSSEIWSTMRSIKGSRVVSRVWYFGHARKNLWLSLDHNGCRTATPAARETLYHADIDRRLGAQWKWTGWWPTRDSGMAIESPPSKYDPNRSSKFYGCNSDKFARVFAEELNVYAEGGKGTLRFHGTHRTTNPFGGYEQSCTWRKYRPGGTQM